MTFLNGKDWNKTKMKFWAQEKVAVDKLVSWNKTSEQYFLTQFYLLLWLKHKTIS